MSDALLTDVREARRRTVEAVRAIMHQDDALDRMVPSDLRLLIGEIDQLRSDLVLLGPVTTPLSGQDCASCGRPCCADWTYCPSCGTQERLPGDMRLARNRK